MSTGAKPYNLALIFEGQAIHALCLAMLLVAVVLVSNFEGILTGSLFGISTTIWFWLLLADTIIHQLFVWCSWRLELHGQHLTRLFGGTKRAFRLYSIFFALLFGARFVLVTVLAIANRQSLNIDPWIGYLLAILIAIPAVYLFYSVKTYFSFHRAFGADHFEADARNWVFVRQGIFKYTPNAMYVFGIGALWVPALAFQSSAALIAAAFSHAYIWVHYFTVEKPDMRRIYG